MLKLSPAYPGPALPQSIPGRFCELETRLDGWAQQTQPPVFQPGPAPPAPSSAAAGDGEVAPQSKRVRKVMLKVPSGLSASLSWCDATVTAPPGTGLREPGAELQAGDAAVLKSWVLQQQLLVRRVSVRPSYPSSHTLWPGQPTRAVQYAPRSAHADRTLAGACDMPDPRLLGVVRASAVPIAGRGDFVAGALANRLGVHHCNPQPKPTPTHVVSRARRLLVALGRSFFFIQ